MIPFYKYHGAGNDFILLDQRQEVIDYPCLLLAAWCQRRTGVGADGVMYLRQHPQYDFEMLYFNSDGRLGSMCGNGGRCIIAFAADRGIVKPTYRFLAPDGVHEGKILTQVSSKENKVCIDMQDVSMFEKISSHLYFTDTGSPHLVCFVHDVDAIDVQQQGSVLRHDVRFAPAGTNVCFVERIANTVLKVRTYERGVEAETLACGTGAVASALVATQAFGIKGKQIDVQYPGGNLEVNFKCIGESSFGKIKLLGMATFVYSAYIPKP